MGRRPGELKIHAGISMHNLKKKTISKSDLK
jgi:hypothetical protein